MFLNKEPSEVSSFMEFAEVAEFKFQKSYGKGPARPLSADVHKKFSNKKGKLASSWSKKTVADRSRSVGLSNYYDLLYPIASSASHGDAVALGSQMSDGSIPPAPSLHAISLVLNVGCYLILLVAQTYDEVASLGFHERIVGLAESAAKE